MGTRYEHTQPGFVILGASAGAALFAVGLLLRKVAAAKLLPGMFLLGAVGAVFSSLTIVITDKELRASFGTRITPRGLLYSATRHVP